MPLARRKKAYPDGTPVGSIGANLPSFVATHGAATTKTFTLDGNATNLRVIVVDKVTLQPINARLQLVGHNTSIPLQPTSAILSRLAVSKPVDIRVSPDIDNQVDLTVDITNSDPTNDCNVYVSQLFGAETTNVTEVADIKIPVISKYYDWQLENSFSGSGTPAITRSGSNQVALIIAAISASMLVINSAAATPKIQIVGGSAGMLWEHWLAATATASVGGKDAVDLAPLAILDNVFNDTLTIQWDRAIGANTFATLFMAGWLL